MGYVSYYDDIVEKHSELCKAMTGIEEKAKVLDANHPIHNELSRAWRYVNSIGALIQLVNKTTLIKLDNIDKYRLENYERKAGKLNNKLLTCQDELRKKDNTITSLIEENAKLSGRIERHYKKHPDLGYEDFPP